MSRLLVKGGRVVDPSQGIDRALDVLLEDGKVEKLAPRIPARGAELIEAGGLARWARSARQSASEDNECDQDQPQKRAATVVPHGSRSVRTLSMDGKQFRPGA